MSLVPKDKIRKLATGGTAKEQPKLYGTINDNGKMIQVTEQQLNAYEKFIKSQPQDIQRGLWGSYQQLRDGETIVKNGTNLENFRIDDLNDRQDERLGRSRSGIGQTLDATTNNKVHQAALAGQKFNEFDWDVSVSETPKQKTNWNLNKYTIDYNKDDKDQDVYSSSIDNENAINLRSNLLSEFSKYDNYDDFAKDHNISGINGKALFDFSKANPEVIANLMNTIRNGKIDETGMDNLRGMNLFLPGYDEENGMPRAAKQSDNPQAVLYNNYQKYGMDPNRDWAAHGISINDKGELDFSGMPWGRIHALNEFSGFTENSPYRGKYVYNNKVYTRDEAALNPEMQRLFEDSKRYGAINQFADTNGVNWYHGTIPHEGLTYDPNFRDTLFNEQISTLGDNLYYNLSHNYEIVGSPKSRIIAVPDMSKPVDPNTGHRQQMYYYTDKNGVVQKSYTNPGTLRANKDDSATLRRIPYQQRRGSEFDVAESDIFNTYNGMGYAFYEDRNGNFYMAPVKGNDESGWTEDKALRKIDKNAPSVQNVITKWKSGQKPSTSEILAAWNYISPEAKSEQDRKNETTTAMAMSMRKLGGTIEKLQFGGSLFATQYENSNKSTQVNPGSRNITQSATLIGKNRDVHSWDDLTSSDKLELAALGADIGAVAATFVPGAGNIAAAGLGATGTSLGLVADVKRDGLDWGDVGRAGLGYALDAVSLIPGLGTAGAGIKVAGKIKKMGKPILKLLAISGASNAVYTAAKKLITGDDWTTNDLRMVVGGISAGLALGRNARQTYKDAKSFRASENSIASKDTRVTGEIFRPNLNVKGEGTAVDASKLQMGFTNNKPFNNFANKYTNVRSNKEFSASNLPKIKATEANIDFKLKVSEIDELNKLPLAGKKKFISDKLISDYKFKANDKELDKILSDLPISKDRSYGVNIGKKRYSKDVAGKVQGDVKNENISLRQAYSAVNDSKLRWWKYDKRALKQAQVFQKNRIDDIYKNHAADIRSGQINKNTPGANNIKRAIWQETRFPFIALTPDWFGGNVDTAQRKQAVYNWNNRIPEHKTGGKIQKFYPGGQTAKISQSPDYNYPTISQAYRYFFPKKQNNTTANGNLWDWVNNKPKDYLFYPEYTNGVNAKPTAVTSKPQEYNRAQNYVELQQRLDSSSVGKPVTRSTTAVTSKPKVNNNVINEDISELIKSQDEANLVKTVQANKDYINSARNLFVQSSGQDVDTGTNDKFNLKLNPDNILSGLQMIAQNRINKKELQNAKDLYDFNAKNEPVGMQWVHQRFNESPEVAAMIEQSQKARQYKNVTSDGIAGLALTQAQNERADAMYTNAMQAKSQGISAFQQAQVADQKAEKEYLANLEDRRRQHRMGNKGMLSKAQSAFNIRDFQSKENFLLEKRRQFAQDQLKFEKQQAALQQLDAAKNIETGMNDFYNTYQDEYNNTNDPNKGSLSQFVNNRHAAEVANRRDVLNTEAYTNNVNNLLKYSSVDQTGKQTFGNKIGNLFLPFQYKKGGKTSKPINPTDQIWMDNNKATQAAVGRLSKEAMQLFMKMLS